MADKRKRVEGSDVLYRTSKGTIVNTNKAGYDAYKRKKESEKQKKVAMQSLETQLEEAKKQIEELKDLIKKHIK